jgi:class 3 adenylate cyclase
VYHKDVGSVVALTPDQRSAGAGPVRRRWAICLPADPRPAGPSLFPRCRRLHSAMIGALGEAMKQPVERRLAAILAADVAGYSRLMGMDEEGTLAALNAIILGVAMTPD